MKSGGRSKLWASENGGTVRFIAETDFILAEDGFVWYKTSVAGQTEFFTSTDGLKFKQYFYD